MTLCGWVSWSAKLFENFIFPHFCFSCNLEIKLKVVSSRFLRRKILNQSRNKMFILSKLVFPPPPRGGGKNLDKKSYFCSKNVNFWPISIPISLTSPAGSEESSTKPSWMV